MRKKVSLGAAIAFAAITAAITFSLTVTFAMRQFNSVIDMDNADLQLVKKLLEIDDIVKRNYIGDIDNQKTTDNLVAGYLRGIGDTYASYYNADSFPSVSDSLNGIYTGIGINHAKDASGYILVRDVFPDSPALQANIKPGDLIVKIGGEDVNAIGYDNAIAKFSADEGTKLQLVVRRGTEEFSANPAVKKIETPAVYSKMIDSVGFIKIINFDTSTVAQFKRCLNDVIGQNAVALVFDVRDNPGGGVDPASEILDILLPEGNIISATYQNGDTVVLKRSDAAEIDLPMVVITNGNTASAGELFTQDLRDYNKAKIVGTQTFGKGTMQRFFPLSDGSAFRLTVAKYNSAAGINYDGVGIRPDFETPLSAEQSKTVAGCTFAELNISNDPQLKKAVEIATALAKNN